MKKYEPKFDRECNANWKTTCKQGNLYVTECRTCGTVIADGGIPKCLNGKILNDRNSVDEGEKSLPCQLRGVAHIIDETGICKECGEHYMHGQ